jgi:hypothetical protein
MIHALGFRIFGHSETKSSATAEPVTGRNCCALRTEEFPQPGVGPQT